MRSASSVGCVSGMHFERMAAQYAGSRPPYPASLFESLRTEGVIGPLKRVVEVGAGSGLATQELVRSGSEVVAIEPGRVLAGVLADGVPGVQVIVTTLEDAVLPSASFDSAVAATSMHWVDLTFGLPVLHAALRDEGRLAVWRHRFGDDSFDTEFRRRVRQVVAERDSTSPTSHRSDDRPTMSELTTGGWFSPVRTEQWQWSIELNVDQVRRLFRTFSDWNDKEVELVARAAEDLGGVVTEHYRTVLHLLKRTPDLRRSASGVRAQGQEGVGAAQQSERPLFPPGGKPRHVDDLALRSAAATPHRAQQSRSHHYVGRSRQLLRVEPSDVVVFLRSGVRWRSLPAAHDPGAKECRLFCRPCGHPAQVGGRTCRYLHA